ncbi:DUF7937 domain-containing protein [Nocardia higoensis]|uniref:DUF7937 domain-containing protein n=1 Tax=Nocardia higoensis TaxID=228599 RepID=UPI0002DCF261|nr:DUF4190 domain-containing protein [Nocardia higoensis]
MNGDDLSAGALRRTDLLRDGIAVAGLLLALTLPWNREFSVTDGPTALVVMAFLFLIAAAVVVVASAFVSCGWTTVAPGGTALRTARIAAVAPLALLGVGVVLWDMMISIIDVAEWMPRNAGVGVGVWGAFVAAVATAQPRGYDRVSANDEDRWRKATRILAWIAVGASVLALVRLMVGTLFSLVDEQGSILFYGVDDQPFVTVIAAPMTALPALAATLVVALGLTRRDPSWRLTAPAIALGLVIGGVLLVGNDGTTELFGWGFYGLAVLVPAAVAGLGYPVFTGPDALAPGRTWLRAGRNAALWIAVLCVAELVAVIGWMIGTRWSVAGPAPAAVLLGLLPAVLAGVAALIWWPGPIPRQTLPTRPVVLPLLAIAAFMTLMRFVIEPDEWGLGTTVITVAIIVVALAAIIASVTVPSVRAEYAAASRPPGGSGPYGRSANPYASQPHPVQPGHPIPGADRPASVPAYAGSGSYPLRTAPATTGSHPMASPYPVAGAHTAPGTQAMPAAHASSGSHPVAGVPHGQPTYAPNGTPATASRTNGMAIAALVTSFLIAPLGIVFGHIAMSQIKRRHEEGRGLAIAGLVIGYLYTVAAAASAFVIFAVVDQVTESFDAYDSGYSTSTSRYPTSTARVTATPASAADRTSQAILDARIGTCIHRVVGADQGNGVSDVTVTPATCGSGSSTHRVVDRTTDIDDCGSMAWVRTSTETGWLVLCLRAD